MAEPQLPVMVGPEQMSPPSSSLLPFGADPGRREGRGCGGFLTEQEPRTSGCAAERTFPAANMKLERKNSDVIFYFFFFLNSH